MDEKTFGKYMQLSLKSTPRYRRSYRYALRKIFYGHGSSKKDMQMKKLSIKGYEDGSAGKEPITIKQVGSNDCAE